MPKLQVYFSPDLLESFPKKRVRAKKWRTPSEIFEDQLNKQRAKYEQAHYKFCREIYGQTVKPYVKLQSVEYPDYDNARTLIFGRAEVNGHKVLIGVRAWASVSIDPTY